MVCPDAAWGVGAIANPDKQEPPPSQMQLCQPGTGRAAGAGPRSFLLWLHVTEFIHVVASVLFAVLAALPGQEEQYSRGKSKGEMLRLGLGAGAGHQGSSVPSKSHS